MCDLCNPAMVDYHGDTEITEHPKRSPWSLRLRGVGSIHMTQEKRCPGRHHGPGAGRGLPRQLPAPGPAGPDRLGEQPLGRRGRGAVRGRSRRGGCDACLVPRGLADGVRVGGGDR